jgi:hypothetical protein
MAVEKKLTGMMTDLWLHHNINYSRRWREWLFGALFFCRGAKLSLLFQLLLNLLNIRSVKYININPASKENCGLFRYKRQES